MKENPSALATKLDEYGPTAEKCRTNNIIDFEKLAHLLVKDHEWTQEGAATLVELIRTYGSFVLSNAYALALTTGIEDGKSGF